MRYHNFLLDLTTITIVLWLSYSIIAIIYLNILTNKYLMPINRDALVGRKILKSYDSIVEQYKDQKAINILILTGGGVRGMVPLRTLAYMEEKTGKKIGELFDFFSGTSTGAISASSFTVADNFGNYKFSAQDMLNTYTDNIRQIFSSPWYHQFLTLFGLLAPRFLPDGKIKVLNSYFQDLTIGELKGNLLIPVYNIDKNSLQIVKNWSPSRGISHENYLVKDLINGASCPPMLFPPSAFSLNGYSHLLIDPAVLINNPVLHVLLYMKIMFPDKILNVVGIGNGGTYGQKYDYRNMFSFGLYGLYQYLFSAPMLSSKLSIEVMEEYLLDNQDEQNYDKRIAFFKIFSHPKEYLSPVKISAQNIKNIHDFSEQLLQDNIDQVDSIIKTLVKYRV